MSDKKYQIFVSSTYKDLINTRKKVIDAILRLEHFPVGMEWFSASDEEQWEIIENELKTTDYYILILGQRYGTLNSEGIGYTEKEYNYAREIGIPVLSFVRNENASYTNDEREEKREGQKRIKLFREKVLKESMVDFWETPEELVSKVLVALNKQIKRTKRTGWVRGDQAMSADMANELVRLSKENSELREKLSNIQVNERKPKFEIFINEEKELYYKLVEEWENEEISKLDEEYAINKINSYTSNLEKREELLEPMTIGVKDYNDSLTSEMNEVYNNALVVKKKFLNRHFKINVNLKNTGNAIGNYIVMELKFPDELKLIYQKHYTERYNELSKNVSNSLPLLPTIEMYGTTGLTNHPVDYLFFKEPYFKKENMVEENKNTLKLGISDLIHHTETEKDSYFYAEIKKAGRFIINAKIICEELEEPIFYDLPVIVD